MIKYLIFGLFQNIWCYHIPINDIHNYVNPTISLVNLGATKTIINNLKQVNLDANITRKLIHITSAPGFILTWNFYNDNNAQLWAASVPILMSLYLILEKENLSNILSRSNNSNEILKGPVIYTIMLSLMTLIYWTHNPSGILAMTQLSIGDGFSDIIGRRNGKHKWIHNKNKSIEGTIAFFISSYIASNIIMYYFSNILNYNYNINFQDLFLISFICSLIETLPKIDDNISIPLTVIFLYQLMNK